MLRRGAGVEAPTVTTTGSKMSNRRVDQRSAARGPSRTPPGSGPAPVQRRAVPARAADRHAQPVGAAMSGPGRQANTRRAVADEHVQAVGGVDPLPGGVQHALVDHAAGAVEALLAGLEHEHHVTGEVRAGTLLALEGAGRGGSSGPGPGPGPGLTVHRYDLKARKSDVPLTGVSSFQMSSGGDKALYRQGENWIIAALRPMATGPGGGSACRRTAAGGRPGRAQDRRDRSARRSGRRNGSRCTARRGAWSATGSTTAISTASI